MPKFKFEKLDNGYRLYMDHMILGVCKFQKVSEHYVIRYLSGTCGEIENIQVLEPNTSLENVKKYCKEKLEETLNKFKEE